MRHEFIGGGQEGCPPGLVLDRKKGERSEIRRYLSEKPNRIPCSRIGVDVASYELRDYNFGLPLLFPAFSVAN